MIVDDFCASSHGIVPLRFSLGSYSLRQSVSDSQIKGCHLHLPPMMRSCLRAKHKPYSELNARSTILYDVHAIGLWVFLAWLVCDGPHMLCSFYQKTPCLENTWHERDGPEPLRWWRVRNHLGLYLDRLAIIKAARMMVAHGRERRHMKPTIMISSISQRNRPHGAKQTP